MTHNIREVDEAILGLRNRFYPVGYTVTSNTYIKVNALELEEFIRSTIDHQARKEERERAAKIVEQYMEDNEYWQPIASAILEKRITRKKNHPELDQDKK